MHGGGFGGVWTTEIIICLVVDHGRTKEIIICLVADHAWTMEIVQEKQQYIKKNNTEYRRLEDCTGLNQLSLW